MNKWTWIAAVAAMGMTLQAEEPKSEGAKGDKAESQPAKGDAAAQANADWTKEQFIAMQKAKWEEKGWKWNQQKVEAMFEEMDTDKDGIATGKERKAYWAKKSEKTDA